MKKMSGAITLVIVATNEKNEWCNNISYCRHKWKKEWWNNIREFVATNKVKKLTKKLGVV